PVGVLRDRISSFKIEYSDFLAPTTVIHIDGHIRASGMYNEPVTVTFTAVDDSSGIDQTLYGFSGDAHAPYSGPITLDWDGTYNLTYRSRDRAGNLEAPKLFTISIDRTPPVTNASSSTPQQNGWYNVSPAHIDFHPTDLAGVEHTFCALDDTPITACSSGI